MHPYVEKQRRFGRHTRLKLVVFAVLLGCIWAYGSIDLLKNDEKILWEKVRSAQEYLRAWREETGVGSAPSEDPHGTGFIGLEWSAVTTTLGPLEAKRTAADPLWAVHVLRFFRNLGIAEGDPVAVISSSSFPGLVFSVLAAAEHAGLKILWIHSLGASTWGANHPQLPWPGMASALRNGGYLAKKADRYTLGGRGEMGLDLSPEGKMILENAAQEEGIPLLSARSVKEMTEVKMALIRSEKPRLLVSIGGSASTLSGSESEVLQGGFFLPGSAGNEKTAEGVIRAALGSGIPVLHFLGLRRLAGEAGIPYDGVPVAMFLQNRGKTASVSGLAFFFLYLFLHPRWKKGRS